MTHLTRRRALRLAALSTIAAAAAACGLGPSAAAPPPATPQAAGAPAPLPRPTTTTGAEAGAPPPPTIKALGQGPTVSITPNSDFYTVAITTRSNWLKAETWKLTVSGKVDHPLSLTLDDLKKLPIVEQMRTLECISNPVGGNLISNAMWKGVRLADVLQQAGVQSTAVEIKLTSADGYSTAIPLALADHPDSLLVFEMNGVPLPDDHGAPLRALFPGRYGMKQPKWIVTIEAIAQPYLGHWERQGWSNDAIVKVNSQVRTPDDGEVITVASYPVSGTVFSSDVGVARLEVSTDGGKTWQEAGLVRGPTPLAWSEWRYDWLTPPSGSAAVIARATDNDGNQQPVGTTRLLLPDAGLDGVWAAQRVAVTIKK